MMKHWLTNTLRIEIVKKSGPVGELNPGPLDVRSRTLPLRHTGSQRSQRVIMNSQDFITIPGVSSEQHNTVLEIFEDGL